MEKLGQNNIYSQYLGNKAILRTYKGTDLINEYVPLYTPPVDWSDIRTDCPENSIALYAAHSADYSSYNNLGFTATCIGGYNVFIDGTQYGSTYASGSTCNITWSSLALDTGDNITTPSALKAHKIWIEPATEGNNITNFKNARTISGTSYQNQGILWVHFNIDTSFDFCIADNYTRNTILEAITAKNNEINILSSMQFACIYSYSLIYTPVFVAPQTKINMYAAFNNCSKLQKVKFKNIFKAHTLNSAFGNCSALLELPKIDFSETVHCANFATNTINLKNTIFDISAATQLTSFGIHGDSSNFVSGLKGVIISNEAPFNNATAPQINVNYTGMDRNALVQLFNDLPYNVGYEVVGSPTIESGIVSGFSSSDYLTSNFTFPNTEALNGFVAQVKFTTPNDTSFYGKQLLTTRFSSANSDGIYLGSSGRIGVFLGGRINQIASGGNYIQANTTYVARMVISNGYVYLYCGPNEDNLSLIASKEIESFTTINPALVRIGTDYSTSKTPFTGSIDLNNTYIKINDVYLFRGQPAMTKTLSCVGATGTADLTAEDKDIALNKGWSLTLS